MQDYDLDEYSLKEQNEILLFERQLVGKSLSSYKIVRPIGGKNVSMPKDGKKKKVDPRGCNGGVYLVEFETDEGEKRKLALKIAFNYLTGEERFQTTKIRKAYIEPEFCRRLPAHRNLARTHHVFISKFDSSKLAGWNFDESIVSSKSAFFVMKYYPESLHSFLQQDKQDLDDFRSPKSILKFILQITRGIIVLKKHDIVHRDLKPDNIFMEIDPLGEWNFAIGDFGESLDCQHLDDFSEEMRSHRHRGGAMYYMPPEIYYLEPGRDSILRYGKYDIFSLGMICHHIYTKRPPFVSNLEVEGSRFKKRSKESFKPLRPEECRSEAVRNLITRMCHPNISKRIPAGSAAQLIPKLLMTIEDTKLPNLRMQIFALARKHEQQKGPEESSDDLPAIKIIIHGKVHRYRPVYKLNSLLDEVRETLIGPDTNNYIMFSEQHNILKIFEDGKSDFDPLEDFVGVHNERATADSVFKCDTTYLVYPFASDWMEKVNGRVMKVGNAWIVLSENVRNVKDCGFAVPRSRCCPICLTKKKIVMVDTQFSWGKDLVKILKWGVETSCWCRTRYCRHCLGTKESECSALGDRIEEPGKQSKRKPCPNRFALVQDIENLLGKPRTIPKRKKK